VFNVDALYKLIDNLLIYNLNDNLLIDKVAARSQLRSARRHPVVVPRYNRSTYGRRAFYVAGAITWNSFTDSLRDPSLSIDSFRRQLKTFLFYNRPCVFSAFETFC